MPVSLWFDGCFDGFHYAHANAVRQALHLINGEKNPRILVGVHSDKEILKNKGPPLFEEKERYDLIRGCRWVDEVVENVPYVTCLDIIRKQNIDFVVHGDDIVLDAEGNDCYAALKRVGKYKECKRTEGISTTSLIERILRPDEWALAGTDNARLKHLLTLFVDSVPKPYPVLCFESLTTDDDFDVIRKGWPEQHTIIYVGGSWDCFGSGHVELLRRAKIAASTDGASLIVGVWSDEVLEKQTSERPLLSLLERALAIVQCKYSDAIILSPPVFLPRWIVSSLGIKIIVGSEGPLGDLGVEHVSLEAPPLQNIANLRQRLLAQHDLYEERQKRKGSGTF